MNTKITLFIFLTAGILLSSGCAKELTTNELQSRLIQANSDMNTYTIDMKMSMDLSMITRVLDNPMTIKYSIISNGDIDRANKKMALKGTAKSDMTGMSSLVDTEDRKHTETQEMDAEIYIQDGYLYTRSQDAWIQDVWIKTVFEDELWIQQDKIGALTELIETATIERQKDESFNSNSYYVIKINPDLGKVAENTLTEQQPGSLPPDINYDNLIKEYSSTLWVNKKTFIIEKSRTELRMVITAEDIDEDDMLGTESMEITSLAELQISNINEPMNIALPEEAQNAIDPDNLVTPEMLENMMR